MDAIGKALGKVSGENKSSSSSPLDLNVGPGQSAQLPTALVPTQWCLVLITRALRQAVSYWEYSELCAIFFVAGVVFGYKLRGPVRHWASKVLQLWTDT